jgi:enamine deaminase RidA (YjgF/YER057c/UK114 family)
MPTDEYASLLAKIEGNQKGLSDLSQGYEMQTRRAYLQARDDINERIQKIISDRGGLEGLSSRDRWRITRDTGLIENIDGRLAEMGSQHTNIVTQAFQEGGTLARQHLGDELTTLVNHVNKVSGTALPVAAVVDFARLDTTAIELGLGTALNDTAALTQATRLTMQREITAGVAAGEGIRDLSARIDGLEGISRNRAEVITRWATIKSYNLSAQATYEAAEQSIPGIRKMWLTQTDERACPHCLAQHGQVVDVVDDFDPNLTYAGTAPEPYQGFLEEPPLHPRCRCSITSWHEDWRAYTTQTPEELSEFGREKAIEQGHPNASLAGVQGVAPEVGIRTAAGNALGEIMRGVYVFDDFSGTVRIADGADMNLARLRLRDAGFRVRDVPNDPRLLRIEFPRGLKLPRMVRSTKLKALPPGRWAEIKRGLLQCGLK